MSSHHCGAKQYRDQFMNIVTVYSGNQQVYANLYQGYALSFQRLSEPNQTIMACLRFTRR